MRDKASSAATEVVAPIADPPEQHASRRLYGQASSLVMVWLLVALVIAARVVYPGFFSTGNIENILIQNAPLGIVAVGMTFVMIGGGFDLSVGAVFAFGAVVYAKVGNDIPLGAALGVCIAVGCVLGTINGIIVTRLRVNPFVATLGTASIFSALAFLYTDSRPVTNTKANFDFLSNGELLGVSISIWLLGGALIVGGLLLARTVYGRCVYSVGGNTMASRLAGMRVDLIRGSTYVIVGGCAALGGALLASRIGVGQADVGGSIALDAIAIVVIGGTSLFGGEGAIWRSAVGLAILSVITNLSNTQGWNANVEGVITGSIIIFAVAVDALTRARRALA